jgi:tartrate dehydratase beta subunit/fumarate hydratase class I family protein
LLRSPSAPPPKAAKGPLPFLRLDTDAHLLVALSSAERLPDGSFEFRGTLLLPVAHAGPVPLDRGAEVVGAGQTRDGQTSLAVMEFIVQGVRYMLKEGSGAMKAQTPGTGGAVQFERSQVLEMWPGSSLVYERAPATAALVRIQLGQTIPEVVTVLGQPERIVNLGSKQIYVYKELRITFLEGKVSDVQ